MKTLASRFTLICALAVLSACGSDSPTSAVDTSNARGTLVDNPPFRIASLNAADLKAQLSASAFAPLLPLTGDPACGVDFHYIHYWTVGGNDEPEYATGALMIPTGAAPQCSGARPMLLYAHGTQVDKTINIADPTNPKNQEGVLVAAMFAAQGYIVVAPNYVGYDTSTADYHPYLNEDAESKDMIDALTASRSALGKVLASGTTDNGRLFITGYSQGGHVAMATHKAMEAAGMAVTASGTMSGPYALEAFGDFAFTGHVGIYSTLFYPMLVTSYQRAYGNAYGPSGAMASDFYEAAYAATIEGLLPSATSVDELIANGQIPALALFNSAVPVTGTALDGLLAIPPDDVNHPENKIFQLGFGTGNLVKNEVRIAYVSDLAGNPDRGLVTLQDCVFGGNLSDPNCAAPGPTAYAKAATTPTLGLRADLFKNDLRDWVPAAPVMLCGGKLDPVVTYPVNTGIMSLWWQTNGVPVARTAAQLATSLVTVLDLETGLGAGDPFAAAEAAFQGTMGQIELDAYTAAFTAAHDAWLAAHAGDTAGADAAGTAAGTAASNAAYASNYHQTVEPFCQAAVRGYFASIP
jgi:poly(3-hydroxybutyrate) depolymerase